MKEVLTKIITGSLDTAAYGDEKEDAPRTLWTAEDLEGPLSQNGFSLFRRWSEIDVATGTPTGRVVKVGFLIEENGEPMPPSEHPIPLAELDDQTDPNERLNPPEGEHYEGGPGVKRIIETIRANPGCVVFYDNDCWSIYTKTDWDDNDNHHDPILNTEEEGVYYTDLLEALAQMAGIQIAPP